MTDGEISGTLAELSDKHLMAEFDRLGELKAECEASMREIRAEQARRRDAEIASLQAQLAARAHP